jgi:hypothetical protein
VQAAAVEQPIAVELAVLGDQAAAELVVLAAARLLQQPIQGLVAVAVQMERLAQQVVLDS